MADEADFVRKLSKLRKAVSAELDCDIVFFAGSISYSEDQKFCRAVRSKKSQKNVLVLVNTFGGSADSAYRMARCLQDIYASGRILVFVHKICKSAGTLLLLCANEVIMSDDAELGPLDVQLRKPDEIDERTSGLTPMQSLATLRQEAYISFEEFFIEIRRKTRITSKTAAEIAANLTVGLFSKIYEQLEPMRLGENDRAMRVGEEYGSRIASRNKNLRQNALESLITQYPSHEFIIDRHEAEKLFHVVRVPSESETELANLLEPIALKGIFDENGESIIHFLESDDLENDDGDAHDIPDEESQSAEDGESAGLPTCEEVAVSESVPPPPHIENKATTNAI
jgi:hypothetical protein